MAEPDFTDPLVVDAMDRLLAMRRAANEQAAAAGNMLAFYKTLPPFDRAEFEAQVMALQRDHARQTRRAKIALVAGALLFLAANGIAWQFASGWFLLCSILAALCWTYGICVVFNRLLIGTPTHG